MRVKIVIVLVCLAVPAAFSLSTSGQVPSADQAFHQAIRHDDLTALRALIVARGANSGTVSGLTPLMMAVAFGTSEAARLLVDAGANVNPSPGPGLTPLHLAWRDPDTARLLLDRGANVHAKSTNGRTPLVVTAFAEGTVGVAALLIEKGADVNAGDNNGLTPLVAAAAAGNTAVARLLLEHGADVNANASSGVLASTPLMGAAMNGDAELARLLLARKPHLEARSPDNNGIVKNGPVAFGQVTALHLAVAGGNSDVVRMLLEAGAPVDARDVRGMTPLTWSVATDRADPRIVRLLLDKGAMPGVASSGGETTLDWARKYNNPAVLRELKLDAVATATAAVSLQPRSVRADRTPRKAVERSMTLLREGSSGVMVAGGCVACHAQPMSVAATELAARRGWQVGPSDEALAQASTAINGAVQNHLMAVEGGAFPDAHLYNALALAVAKVPANLATDVLVYYLAAKQRAAGNWHGQGTRPPIQDGDFSHTAMAIRALVTYGTPTRRSEVVARINRAAEWLAAQAPRSTEDRAMQLLGLSWAGAHAPAREQGLPQLLGLQHPDGGWGQTPYLESDAYATGQVLYVLGELGLPRSNAAVQRGVAFLVGSQREDGTWHVKSRAMKIQPYFQSGFPYDHDQWISQSGTAWAAMGLATAAADDPARAAAR